MDDENDKCDLYSSRLSNQMRAVSSPSLSDNHLENHLQNNSKNLIINSNNKNHENSTENNFNLMSPFTTTVNVNNQNYAGVLQKFRKTFSQFGHNYVKQQQQQQQQQTTSTNIPNDLIDFSGKYRFGPLIWRSSKERRKTKYNRRDKCNSGDSGIQIELENDETFLQDVSSNNGQEESSIESITTTTTTGTNGTTQINATTTTNINNTRLRRTNSAKATNSIQFYSSGSQTAKSKAFKKLENHDNNKFITTVPKPKRSLSQPNGLDRITRNELDESDSDSVSSHPDLHETQRPIYAEILFPFIPVGPEELPLERGCLVEILRKDNGPWWYGKLKNDEIFEKILESQQGWFPKDFVRIISPYNQQQQQQQQQQTEIVNQTQIQNIENLNVLDKITNENLIINNINENSITTTAMTTKNSTEILQKMKSSSQQTVIATPTNISSQLKLGLHNNESLRNSVVKELLETEVNYVKLLSTLCLGYLKEMRKRIDIFPTESLNLIFSNIENVWQFQQIFLNSLRKGIESGNIGQAFLDHQSGFLVYSNYCNSYPRALMELESYSSSKDAKIILENIRVAENLSNLPLSAHLLAPIQRICRYPLHLAELVKQSPSSSNTTIESNKIDCTCSSKQQSIGDTKEGLDIALNAMKKVTETVNEGKRHSEHLSRFQSSFENFQGPPIAFHSTRFFMQTDATRVSPNLWNNTYTLFLFDRQLIYCKKDILKRNHYIYKGRIFLDNCRILNLPDGKMFGVTLKNALRIYCESLNKWFDFCFRSASRKLRFLSTLAVERQFCGTNLFVSELAGDDDCDNLSDREYHSDYDTPSQTQRNSENNLNNLNWKQNLYDCDKIQIDLSSNNSKLQKYCDTLPKKSRKFTRNNHSVGSSNVRTNGDNNNYDGYNNTSSLGRRKIGSWFRKAKSTNTTPTQSPTHNPVNLIVFNSDSSSQSSPALDGGGTYKLTLATTPAVATTTTTTTTAK